MSKLPTLELFLANPRGFCAGVERAINIVEEALKVFKAPIYVKHEIVHNRFVVESLRDKGVIFINDLDEVDDKEKPVILSAHGASKKVIEQGKNLNLKVIDATCPLVSKVHRESEIFNQKGFHILLIGHAGHPEVEGTMGQLPDGCVTLIESDQQAKDFTTKEEKLAYVTQTTLSVNDTKKIIDILKSRFPEIVGPKKSDICYATTNRQDAVKNLAKKVSFIMVIGSPNSSNSCRLVELARESGCKAELVEDFNFIPWDQINGLKHLGVTAGASAPEVLLEEIVQCLRQKFTLNVQTLGAGEENVFFRSPPIR